MFLNDPLNVTSSFFFPASYCKHVTTYEESNFSQSYQFILNLFSFLLRIKTSLLHEEVSLIEKRLFKTKYTKTTKKSSRSRKARKSWEKTNGKIGAGGGVHPWYVEFPGPGMEPVPQSWQCQILNPLCHKGTSRNILIVIIMSNCNMHSREWWKIAFNCTHVHT